MPPAPGPFLRSNNPRPLIFVNAGRHFLKRGWEGGGEAVGGERVKAMVTRARVGEGDERFITGRPFRVWNLKYVRVCAALCSPNR